VKGGLEVAGVVMVDCNDSPYLRYAFATVHREKALVLFEILEEAVEASRDLQIAKQFSCCDIR
jgi:hypothetical protein